MQAQPVCQVISVNVGLPRTFEVDGKPVTTGIYKTPVRGRIAVHNNNLEGDRQADLRVHGGPEKAIYVYPAEYYDYWRQEYPGRKLEWGMFGENLTTTGLLDAAVHIGDTFRIGTVEVVVTQPRFPCYKLGIKFENEDIIKHFQKSSYSGFYLGILKEGELGAGDAIIPLTQDENRITVADINRLFTRDKNDVAGMRRAIRVDALAADFKKHFQERLINLEGHI